MTTSPLRALIGVSTLFAGAALTLAQQPTPTEDGWSQQYDPQLKLTVQTKELTIHPKAVSKPVLSRRLIVDEFDAVQGNAALYYLKAAGFLEEDAARQKLNEFINESVERAKIDGINVSDQPPYVWLKTAPDALPVDQVKKYLKLLDFQEPLLREGARRDHFDMNRNFRQVDDPIALLLPEIQKMREIARTQSLRTRLAIAEGRLDDAIDVIGQQFAMARHLGQDEFLVSNLVGIAIATIAWNDMFYLVTQPDTPNLYWAVATMPRPLVSMRHSMAMERQLLYQQVKVLKEVDPAPRAAGYWRDFIDRVISQAGSLASEFHLHGFQLTDHNHDMARARLIAYIAAAYPGSKEFLIDEMKMPRDQVEAYPTAQVVFLAIVGFHDRWRDEYFKWMYLPYWQARTKKSSQVDQAMDDAADQYGWCAWPTMMLLPAVRAARTAEARCSQNIAILKTIEALRMYAAENDSKLPESLEELSVPAPIEPFTGKPIEYELRGNHAVITGHETPGLRSQLVIRVAQE